MSARFGGTLGVGQGVREHALKNWGGVVSVGCGGSLGVGQQIWGRLRMLVRVVR